jgi:inner membrane protein
MDPITHTMVGAAIAAASSRRPGALAIPAGILAANVADIDIFSYLRGEYAALAFRRGWTHGPPALVVSAAVVLAVVLLWDRRVRRRRDPAAQPARAGPLLAIIAAAVMSHPLLDWMNTYGIRWLMPFDRRWYYGDALFIMDPWLWLLLGVPLFLLHSRRRAAVVAWAALAVVLSVLVMGTGAVPPTGRMVWLAALAAAATLRIVRRHVAYDARLARAGLIASGAYVAAMVANTTVAERIVEAAAVDSGIAAHRIMVAPAPADPLRGGVVVTDGRDYTFGEFDWSSAEPATFRADRIPVARFDTVVSAAAAIPEARDFLVWSRFPIAETRAHAAGYTVRFRDARYPADRRMGSLGGITIRLDPALRPVPDIRSGLRCAGSSVQGQHRAGGRRHRRACRRNVGRVRGQARSRDDRGSGRRPAQVRRPGGYDQMR